MTPLKGRPSAFNAATVGRKISLTHRSTISGVYLGEGQKAPIPPVLGPWLPS